MRTLLISLCFVSVVTAAEPTTVDRAAAWVTANDSAEARLGLSELRRAAGQSSAALDDLRKLAADPACADLHCWRLLPTAAAQPVRFRAALAALPERGETWRSVYQLCDAANRQDRRALVALAASFPEHLPKSFPGWKAEEAHLNLMRNLGHSLTAAGCDVIQARSFAPLYALGDLDRTLTREAEFLTNAGRPDDGIRLRTCRDRLRDAYVKASAHAVERLFALKLSGRIKERDALLGKMEALPYLHDDKARDDLFTRLGEESTWRLVIEPLLRSEVTLIENPPDLAKPAPQTDVELTVEADVKVKAEYQTLYTGKVRATLGQLTIKSDGLTVHGEGAGVTLVGTGNVRVSGVTGTRGAITADRFSFVAETGAFTFGGDVRIPTADGLLKLRACVVNRAGEVGERQSLLDDFRRNVDTDRRLELLPKIAAIYADDELPADVRLMLALSLLRPHLTWHAPYLPPKPGRERLAERLRDVQKSARAEDVSPWQPALGGEFWMRGDVTDAQLDHLKRELQERSPDEQPADAARLAAGAEKQAFFWRIKDPGHADVARAKRLLAGVEKGDRAEKARRWLAEVERNNTVLTLDVSGSYGPQRDAPLLLDARNADRLAVALYRVEKADDLLWVTNRIGTDFIFRDHGLQYRDGRVRERVAKMAEEVRSRRGGDPKPPPIPAVLRGEPVRRWTLDVKDLPVAALHHDESHWDDARDADGEGEFFDDACFEFRERLRRSYRPEGRVLSSWRCERILKVPGRMLAKPGAYVIAIEANGQTAYAPLVVDPLSLSLERCRDGVLAVVHEPDGLAAVAGATVTARGILSATTTDREGVAFARVFAAGDRAIVAAKDGRFAVGGFGRVFAGVYKTDGEEERDRLRDRLDRKHRAVETREAQLYEDRFIVAAYTDRPTYRPGQQVQFKLIVRQLPPNGPGPAQDQGFRAEDFEVQSRLAVPKVKEPLAYTVIDVKGRTAGEGHLGLNDFGTAAGDLTLSAEAPTGSYTLRVRIGGRDRIVPAVFAVKYYRRPTFELTVAGVPEKPGDYTSLKLTCRGEYYFGKPVASGALTLRLVGASRSTPLAEAHLQLDAVGKLAVEFAVPSEVRSGSYRFVAELRDETGRMVQKSFPVELRRKDDPAPRASFASLPRFLPAGKDFILNAGSRIVAARGLAPADGAAKLTFAPRDGRVTLNLPATGWYTLTAGDESAETFAYGGKESPWANLAKPKEELVEDGNVRHPAQKPGWVNLARLRAEDPDEAAEPDDPRHDLFALFDRHEARVGAPLRVLVYAPFDRARLLFTCEGHSVRDYHAATVDGSASHYHVIELPVRPRHLPHFYLGGHVLHGTGGKRPEFIERHRLKQSERLLREDEDDGTDPAWCRVEVADPRRPANDERLTVDLTTDRAEYRPGDTVKVALKVRTLDGQPADAEISLGAVDESVYTFGEDRVPALARLFTDPHPAELLRPKTWRSVVGRRWKILSDENPRDRIERMQAAMKAMQEMAKAVDQSQQSLQTPELARGLSPLALDGLLPVATVPLARLRADFRETAAWVPQLRTDAKGESAASFILPDTLTRYRLTAVALDRQANVGSARVAVQARLPLSVQLVLPRFAVEKDRFLAYGLVHNTTAREQACDVAWELKGIEAVKGAAVRGRVTVGAGQTRRVALELLAKSAGVAEISLRCTAEKHADAEKRTLPIQPLGREREVVLEGTFTGKGAVTIPAGFEPREVQVVLARDEVARSFEGLGSLIDYPYGCVEQTMSRFLPAVVVRDAGRRVPVHLPPEVAAKLPRVYALGLARLARFQHADGGWGWWDNDASHDGMTAYVVSGLALCRRCGVAADPAMLERGCAFLRQRLRDGKLSGLIEAKAVAALVPAGKIEPAELARVARRRLEANAGNDERALLALACRRDGLHEEAEQLVKKLRDWKPADAEGLALLLETRVAFGAPLAECRAAAADLLRLRNGDRWANTQATAAAILALADFTAYASSAELARPVAVMVDGKEVAAVRDPEALKKLVLRLDLPAAAFRDERRTLELVTEGEQPLLYTVVVRGVEHLDEIAPTGKEVVIRRRRETLDGKPLDRPLKVGEVCAVRLSVELEKAQDFMMVEDRRPAGCEFADEQALRNARGTWASTEFRDDRVCLFFTRLEAGRHEVVYYLRAETPGASHILPGFAHPMYAEHLHGETGSDRVEVRE
jgi:hypothetical protein